MSPSDDILAAVLRMSASRAKAKLPASRSGKTMQFEPVPPAVYEALETEAWFRRIQDQHARGRARKRYGADVPRGKDVVFEEALRWFLARFERHFTINSACGVCGRAQLDALRDLGIGVLEDDLRVPQRLLYELPQRMRASQRIFASTGGLHAAALFDERGESIAVREDVGRHNAVDKLVGWGLLNARLPFARTILMVSGRTSYEILQKSAMARIPIVCSVSAPSSLAVDLARAFNITLVGFLRGERANVYAAPERLRE